MKSLFAGITRLSLRFRWVTIAIAILVSIAGIVAITQLRQELIPAVEFPQTIILSQASGMTSEQVLNVVTSRLEAAINEQVPDVANLESTTTGSFGSVITARNDFGLNQERIRSEITTAIDSVWLPVRRIEAPEGEAPAVFAARLLSDLPADVLLYLADADPNFLFQLSPEVWQALSDETTATLLAYLANAQQTQSTESALRQLVDLEIAPALEGLTQVASVQVSGGQVLPDENGAMPTAQPAAQAEPRSLLTQLSPEVWAVASAKAGYDGPLDDAAVAALRQDVTAPEAAPALPESWQAPAFKDATDLQEMRTLTLTTAAVLNRFVDSGRIIGALGQTDDLTPEVIQNMLAIDPTMVEYFKAEQLAAMSPEVFAALPADFIAGLDGFTRDELAARALAQSITGEDAQPDPVDLPAPWRIAQPQLITFSFDDLPLATFSIAAQGEVTGDGAAAPDIAAEATPAPTPTAAPTDVAIPEGPALPLPFALLGGFIGTELNTADDLINIQLPEAMASQFGGSQLTAAQLLSFLLLLNNPDALPAGVEVPNIPIDAKALIGSLSPDAIAFLAANDPTFLPNLTDDVFDAFSDGVLSLPEIAPPLDSVWSTLADQPQFASQPLKTARDLVLLGNGSPSSVLNTINDTVPAAFEGYEVRLFDSLTPATLRYLSLQEPGFIAALDVSVLTKFSPVALASLPANVVSALPADVQARVNAIAGGEQPSAAAALAELYTTDAPPADPNAPELNPDWQFVADFLGVELNSADDFFRFFPDPSAFLNSLFDTANGQAFAPRLFGGLSPAAAVYMYDRDPGVFDNLVNAGLELLPAETLAALPQSVQDRAASGGEAFRPTDPVTRTNGQNSLLVTIYKSSDANTVEAFHTAEEAVQAILAEHPNVSMAVAFEQASFIEESISGVAREGGLGAIFAIIVILIFLSSGKWASNWRRITGAVIIGIFILMLGAVSLLNAGPGGNLTDGWVNTDVLVRSMLLLGIGAGFFILLWPTNMARPAWRSTLVTAVSIPLSILMALALMNWLPGAVHGVLAPAAEGSAFLSFFLRLFPESITLNIMTLSGLTVAIGRVVDDSIVVLENIFRHIQEGGDKKEAIIMGVKDVSVAIFAATIITVVVFLPLGLTGGIIGEFFLPFGLAVTYALLSSFVVAITVVPVVAFFMLDASEMEAEHTEGRLEKIYLPALRWSLAKGSHRNTVLGLAFLSLLVSAVLFARLPQAFLPSFGEPQISVAVNLPAGTSIIETNRLTEQFEQFLTTELPEGEVSRIQTTAGGAGASLQSLLLGGGGVTENQASITIAIENQANLDALTAQIRAAAESTFGAENVTVSAASLTEQGFGGFALVLSGTQEDLVAANQNVIDTLNTVPGLTNVSSNLAGLGTGGGEDAPETFIRIDQQPAVRYTAELETQNTLGVTAQAKAAVLAMTNLPASITVSEGFETQLQTQGFANLFVAMGIAIFIVVIILMITFRSLVHWIDIILSIVVAPVGAAIALTLTNRVLGISALIGMLMLIGIVVTNAVVLIDRVQSNIRDRKMGVNDALIEGGNRRLRPILMTAIATVMALIPLAIGLSQGAIIASELGTVVIGGLVSSTILTLLVVPVAFGRLEPLNQRINRMFSRSKPETPSAEPAGD